MEKNQSTSEQSFIVLVAFGANLGDPIEALQDAFGELSSHWQPLGASRIYRTEPVGGVEQEDFVNGVALFATTEQPIDVLARLNGIEDTHGRTREVRWGPRTLDLDVIAIWQQSDETLMEITSTDPHLTLPHPRAHERSFVIVPWLEIDVEQPLATLPGWGPIANLPAASEALVDTGCHLGEG